MLEGARTALAEWITPGPVVKGLTETSPAATELFQSLSLSTVPPRRNTHALLRAYSEMPGLRGIVQTIAEAVAAHPLTINRAIRDGNTRRSFQLVTTWEYDFKVGF